MRLDRKREAKKRHRRAKRRAEAKHAAAHTGEVTRRQVSTAELVELDRARDAKRARLGLPPRPPAA